MAKGDMKVIFDIEPIVKLTCLNAPCVNNQGGTCNLKHLSIDDRGVCRDLAIGNKSDPMFYQERGIPKDGGIGTTGSD